MLIKFLLFVYFMIKNYKCEYSGPSCEELTYLAEFYCNFAEDIARIYALERLSQDLNPKMASERIEAMVLHVVNCEPCLDEYTRIEKIVGDFWSDITPDRESDPNLN